MFLSKTGIRSQVTFIRQVAFFILHFGYSLFFIYKCKDVYAWKTYSAFSYHVSLISIEELQWNLLVFLIVYFSVARISSQESVSRKKATISFVTLLLHGLLGLLIVFLWHPGTDGIRYPYLFLIAAFQIPVIINCLWLSREHWKALIMVLLIAFVPTASLEIYGYLHSFWSFEGQYIGMIWGTPIEEIICILLLTPPSLASAFIIFNEFITSSNIFKQID